MIEFINHLAYIWWDWMGAMFWQAALLVLLMIIVDLLIRRWIWPQIRYMLWVLVFIKLLIPPSFYLPTAVVPEMFPDTRNYISQQWEKRFPNPNIPASTSSAAKVTNRENAEAIPIASAGTPEVIPQAWLLWIWISGILLFLIFLSIRISRLRAWHREQKEHRAIPPWFHDLMVETGQRLKLERLPAIVFNDKAVTPAVYGVFRPVLLLPTDYLKKNDRQEARHVLLHEMCHLKRGDLWLHGVTLLLQIFYWFNPLLILAMRQIRHVREICCDSTLSRYLREETELYRNTLVKTARRLFTERVEPGMGLLGVFEEPFWLVARIRWLKKNTWRQHRAISVTSILTFFLLAVFLLPMAAPRSETNESNPAQPIQLNSGKSQSHLATSSAKAFHTMQVTREITYFLWIKTESHITAVEDSWFTKSKAALMEKNRTFLLDRDSEKFYLVNHRRKSFLEAPLPLNREKLLSPSLLRLFKERMQAGKVIDTGKKEKILGYECRLYRLLNWPAYEEKPADPIENIVWVSRNLPFNISLLDESLVNMRLLLSNRSLDLQQSMAEKMPGVQMRIKFQTSQFPRKRLYIQEMKEVGFKELPENTFSIPKSYRQIEQLEFEDIR